jgi:hypothetical protein
LPKLRFCPDWPAPCEQPFHAEPEQHSDEGMHDVDDPIPSEPPAVCP